MERQAIEQYEEQESEEQLVNEEVAVVCYPNENVETTPVPHEKTCCSNRQRSDDDVQREFCREREYTKKSITSSAAVADVRSERGSDMDQERTAIRPPAGLSKRQRTPQKQIPRYRGRKAPAPVPSCPRQPCLAGTKSGKSAQCESNDEYFNKQKVRLLCTSNLFLQIIFMTLVQVANIIQ